VATNQVKTKWYSELYYEFDQSLHCCGLADCGRFTLETSTDEKYKEIYGVSFTTIEEVAKDFRSNLLSRLKNYRTAVAQATTTTRERDKEINEVMALAGWKKVKRFRNQKTGNTVIMWTFSKRK
jgi:hypothetical protein